MLPTLWLLDGVCIHQRLRVNSSLDTRVDFTGATNMSFKAFQMLFLNIFKHKELNPTYTGLEMVLKESPNKN